MIRRLIDLLGHAVERRLHAIALDIIVAMSVALFSAISLGFGTFAAYGHLRDLLGGNVAASMVCASYGLTAITIGLVWRACRRKARRAQCIPAAAPADKASSFLQSLTQMGTPQDREVMAAAMRLGQEISPMHLLALALIGGFIVGRKTDK